MVIKEALCFGLPVIATEEVGAVKDLVFDGYNGYLFRYGDVDGLAHYLHIFATSSERDINLIYERSIEIMTKWTSRDLLGHLYKFCQFIWRK